jgi:peptidoglycan-associated lipoprotein
MKIVNFAPPLLLVMALSVAITGCKKTPVSPTPIFTKGTTGPTGSQPGPLENPGPTVPPGPDTRSTQVPGPGTGGNQQNALGPREELNNYYLDRDVFKQDTVYFEFDRYNVRPGELPKLKSVADYMKGQPSFKVLIEGHCDERGTPEYNRALGERRALSIREALIQLGLSGDRVQTVSFGEDKPADPGHNDAAWAKNRRGEFVLMKPKSGGASGQ